MAAAAVKSYSIWAMPRGPLYDKLQAELDQLAARVPSAPHFQPHVTLIGGVRTSEADMLARAQQLAASLKAYRISFDRTAYGNIFHQCVFMLCETDSDTMAAGAATRAAYGQDPASNYMPHLSLLYSDADGALRQSIAAEEQQRLLEGPAPLLGEGERGFDVTSLTVWETEESDQTLLSWRQLAEYPLGG